MGLTTMLRDDMKRFCWLVAAIAAAAGCTSLPPVPLRPQPIAYVDTVPIPEPSDRKVRELRRIMKNALGGEINHALSFSPSEALNVTRYDDVVNSAWFEHRNTLGHMTPEDIRRGPTALGGPDTSRVLTVIGGKTQGISPGFTVRDARGDNYVVKFDPKGFLHLSSGAGVISNRLLYGAGYHVPEDYILVFDRNLVVVDPEATMVDENFIERRMVQSDVDAILDQVDTLPNGRNLAVASRFVPGITKGPFYFEGRRSDDPNDYYHHQYRRDLRGLYVVSSWINHVDMRFANTMDAYVDPGYIRHYLIDFAATLGSGTSRSHSPREGAEYNFDFWPSVARVFTLGFYRMGWEGEGHEVIDPSIGWMQRETFDPAHWKPNWPNQAFRSVTARDGYWGAKLVASFSDEQIEAAVSAGQLPRAAAAEALVDLLIYRRERILEYWYGRVTPVEEVAVASVAGGLEVSFEDLGLTSGATRAATSYRYRFTHKGMSVDVEGESPAVAAAVRQTIRVAPGDAATALTTAADDKQRLATLEITAVRQGSDSRTATVHLRIAAGGSGYEVVGLEH